MVTPLDPTSAAFLYAENRQQPMHVAGLQMFRPPEGAGPGYAREMYESMRANEEISPLFLKHPVRGLTSAGQWAWTPDEHFDIDYHLRHSALPAPGRVRELLDLVSRLHGTRLARERPLWEVHLIEGLEDGRVAMYTKLHHSLVDGVSAMRLIQNTLSTDPDRRDMPPLWGVHRRPSQEAEEAKDREGGSRFGALRSALDLSVEAAGMPRALARTVKHGLRGETSALSLHAPRSMFNVPITGARRFAAQDWPLDRLRAIASAAGTTLNDVVLAMCSGAIRSYLIQQQRLPDSTLVAMVPVSLHTGSDTHGDRGGNKVGAVMVQLGTDRTDPADRLSAIHASMVTGKEALGSMSPLQVTAMSAIGMAPALAVPLLGMQDIVRPAFNLIISNIPGPTTPEYFNGAELVGSYPMSIPINGMALNITCNSYADLMCFGLTGCRRSVPQLQRLLDHLEDEVVALEEAAGIS